MDGIRSEEYNRLCLNSIVHVVRNLQGERATRFAIREECERYQWPDFNSLFRQALDEERIFRTVNQDGWVVYTVKRPERYRSLDAGWIA